jgi:hypothetical protein
VIDIVPDTLGTGPAPTPDPAVPTGLEMKASDANFLKSSTGFYVLEQGGWRWTARDFSLTFPATRVATSLTIRVNVPELEIQKLGTITLTIRAGEHELAPEIFSKAGDYTVVRTLEQDWGNRFDFRVDKILAPTATDGRELGIIFVGAKVELK